MENKILKPEFEVLTENEETVVFKRVLNNKMKAKEKRKREMDSPKVTMHFFTREDIEKLQEIQLRIARQNIANEKNSFSSKFKTIRDFILK